jgi:hypothetical protein
MHRSSCASLALNTFVGVQVSRAGQTAALLRCNTGIHCALTSVKSAVWSAVMLLRATDLHGFVTRLSDSVPARVTAAAALIIVVVNAGAWLSAIVPAVLSSRPTSVLDGTGLVINPVYVQDLAIWLPLLATAAVACWRRAPWGLLVTAAMLAMFVLESISIAVDQWFGSHADRTSSLSSMSMVPAFAVVAAATAGLLTCFLRTVDRSP